MTDGSIKIGVLQTKAVWFNRVSRMIQPPMLEANEVKRCRVCALKSVCRIFPSVWLQRNVCPDEATCFCIGYMCIVARNEERNQSRYIRGGRRGSLVSVDTARGDFGTLHWRWGRCRFLCPAWWWRRSCLSAICCRCQRRVASSATGHTSLAGGRADTPFTI